MGNTMTMAYILISTKPGTSENVAESLRGDSRVVRADSVYGRFDVIALVRVQDLKALDDVVYKVIGSNPDVVHTETAIILFKRQ